MTEDRIAGLTETEFNDQNSKHAGRLKILSAELPDGTDFDVILRPMTRLEFDKFQQDMIKARTRGDSLLIPQANAVRACLIAPSADQYDAAIDAAPGLIDAFMEELGKLAGADTKVREKAFRR